MCANHIVTSNNKSSVEWLKSGRRSTLYYLPSVRTEESITLFAANGGKETCDVCGALVCSNMGCLPRAVFDCNIPALWHCSNGNSCIGLEHETIFIRYEHIRRVCHNIADGNEIDNVIAEALQAIYSAREVGSFGIERQGEEYRFCCMHKEVVVGDFCRNACGIFWQLWRNSVIEQYAIGCSFAIGRKVIIWECDARFDSRGSRCRCQVAI